jgi:glycosyltransferase involved in cell wall biosynthesis
MKISFITTIFNEEKTIDRFLRSLVNQTKLPHEVVIVDGGSSDRTLSIISNFKFPISNFQLKIITKRGNRSVGRNEAIKKATGDIIVCSDSGNVLDKKWLEKITLPFLDSGLHRNDKGRVDVVAGYYKGLAKTVFQKCLIPYALVMSDKVDPENFLPATRSVAFTKAIWKKVGGFDERYSHNEDYVFAHKLKDVGARIIFAKDAIVNWIPRNSFKEAFIMFFRFALGDAEAGIWRTNVLLLFARYFLAIYWIFLTVLYKSIIGFSALLTCLLLYQLWSIKKSYRYVKDKRAFLLLPKLQLTADAAVLSGTTIGVFKQIKSFSFFIYIKQNKFLFFVLAIYIGLLLLTLRWGIPNQNHPYPYHMDEWHQLHAVATTFKDGTPNVKGSANGTMFHFLFSGFYLIPFALFKYIDPFSLQVDNLMMRERVFEILRIQTIFFGVLSLFTLYKTAQVVNVSKKIALVLFTFTPIWLSLSGFFKYDIALLFWILLSLYFILLFAKNLSNRSYVLAGIAVGLSIAVKVSAIPLLGVYAFSFFWFNNLWKKNIKYFFAGVLASVGCIMLFGLPDTLFGRGNVLFYMAENIVQGPTATSNFDFGMSPYVYLFTRHYWVIFGHGLMMLFIFSLLFWGHTFLKDGFKKYKVELFIILSFLAFLLSLLPLQIYGGGNRSLVLLPFFVLIIAFAWRRAIKKNSLKPLFVVVMSVVVLMQVYSSVVWVYMKAIKSPQEISSSWISKHIPAGATIGLENIPIYQSIPDLIQKEYYFNESKIKQKYIYKYQIIDAKSRQLPSVIVMTNGETEEQATFLKVSPKRDLVRRLEKEKYRKIITFSSKGRTYLPFMNDMDYYFSWLSAEPFTTSVYMK